ncbi:P-loop NTPase fold protein [Coraliomargarita algicola]|uniref:P-loop NTPase fold protein n=1 Tax=Coraliomargarita algicola TaxID=3092156 RepID=A0ABZ0RM19_9BACT|nr:P-loop NTPase fold protein [Coraliomargarita sp. J2-16]WPJ96552.1 P-loop NTPase fold protein [Coraliomargarita sp. J2-16]
MSQSEEQVPSRKELEQLPHEAQVAFAARCAIRVFPLVGSAGHFNFWGEDAARSVRSVWAAALAASLGSSGAGATSAVVYTAAYAASSAIGDTDPPCPAYAAKAAGDAAYAGDALYTAASDSARAAKTASSSAWPAFVSAMGNDYGWLLKRSSETLDWSFFQRPLFEGQSVDLEQVVTSEIGKAFESVRGGAELLRMWMEFLHGSPSKDACEIWLDDWLAQNQEVGNKEGVSKSKSKYKRKAESAETDESSSEAPDSVLPTIPTGAATTSAERPAEEDKLNRDGLVKGLANMLSMPEQGTPITVGLFGHWGSGKSSVMQLLQKELSSEETRGSYAAYEFLFGWFNAWEYEHTKDIRAGLAQEVVNGLLSDGSYRPESPRLTKPVKGLEKVRIQLNFLWGTKRRETVWLLVKLFGVLIVFLAGIWGIQEDVTETGILGTGVIGLGCYFAIQLFKEGQALWSHPIATELATFFKLPSYRQELGQIPVIREQLEGLCNIRLSKAVAQSVDESKAAEKATSAVPKKRGVELLKPDRRARRLIMFVDDLDRCHTKTISETFDAIRLIADLDGVIVIVGIDERIAFKAMGEAYKDYADVAHGRTKEDVARDYLGKIIQIPIRLDTPSSKGLETFIDDKLFPKEQRVQKASPPVVTEPLEGGMGPSGFDPDAFQEGMAPFGDLMREEVPDLDEQLDEAQRLAENEKAAAELEKQKQAQAEQEARKQAELEEWNRLQREHMRESDEEVAAFIQLSSCFNFSNPRQLVRLRNTYRLLKALYPNKLKPKEIADGPTESHYPEGEYSLLMMLFWLEFHLQSNEGEVQQWEETYTSPTGTSSETVLGLFDTDFLPQARGEFTEFKWKRLCEFTRTCLLPYPIKEMPKVEVSEQSQADELVPPRAKS